jgi:hypothetical protein
MRVQQVTLSLLPSSIQLITIAVTLLVPGPAMPPSHLPRSDSEGMAHRTVLALHHSSGSDTLSWCQWSSADTDGMCYPRGKARAGKHGIHPGMPSQTLPSTGSSTASLPESSRTDAPDKA